MIIIFPKYIHNRFSLCVIEKFYVIYSQIVNIINKVCWRSLFNKVLVLLILSNLWFCVVYQISQNSSWTLNYWTYLNQNWAVCTCHSYPALQPSLLYFQPSDVSLWPSQHFQLGISLIWAKSPSLVHCWTWRCVKNCSACRCSPFCGNSVVNNVLRWHI